VVSFLLEILARWAMSDLWNHGRPLGTSNSTNRFDRDSTSEGTIKTRKNFPETWIWDKVAIDENGFGKLSNLTIPDTITSWIVTGFGVSNNKGFGTSNKVSILAFQDFFIKLQLPYSIKTLL
jgi:hypothetical protein